MPAACCCSRAPRLAKRGEARGGRQVLVGDAHAPVLAGQAQEAANAEHERDVQAGDAERGQRLPPRRARSARRSTLTPFMHARDRTAHVTDDIHTRALRTAGRRAGAGVGGLCVSAARRHCACSRAGLHWARGCRSAFGFGAHSGTGARRPSWSTRRYRHDVSRYVGTMRGQRAAAAGPRTCPIMPPCTRSSTATSLRVTYNLGVRGYFF